MELVDANLDRVKLKLEEANPGRVKLDRIRVVLAGLVFILTILTRGDMTTTQENNADVESAEANLDRIKLALAETKPRGQLERLRWKLELSDAELKLAKAKRYSVGMDLQKTKQRGRLELAEAKLDRIRLELAEANPDRAKLNRIRLELMDMVCIMTMVMQENTIEVELTKDQQDLIMLTHQNNTAALPE